MRFFANPKPLGPCHTRFGPPMPGPNKRPRFLVLFGNFGGNLGDLFILEQTIRWLRAMFPTCAIDVSPLADRRSHLLEVDIAERHAGVKIASPIFPAVPRLLRSAAVNWPFTLAGLGPLVRAATKRDIDASGLRDLAEAADAVLGIGGGHWGGTFKSLAMLAGWEALAEFAEKTVLLPQSLPPRVAPYVAQRLPHSLAGVSQCFFRDPQSLDAARKLGMRNARLAPDSAFFDVPRDATRRAPPRSSPVIGLCLRANTAGLRECGWQAFARTLAALRDGGAQLRCFTTHLAEDRPIWERCVAEQGVTPAVTRGVEDVLAEIRAADLVVSDRLHVLILATLVGTPVIPVLTLQKVAGYAAHARIPGGVPRFLDVTWTETVAPALEEWNERHRRLAAFARDSQSDLWRTISAVAPIARLLKEAGRPAALVGGEIKLPADHG
jgi:polysaccharide pyruvyl transferase WcaK-like protein